VVDSFDGPTLACDWIEYDKKDYCVYLKGTPKGEIIGEGNKIYIPKHVCCENCTYNRFTYGKCDVFGIETNSLLVCRMFRMPKQSHQSARKRWATIETMKAGFVYTIDNSSLGTNLKPIYKTEPA
jgi:hypothetical protein